MWAHAFADARTLRGFPAGFPQHFGGDGLVGTPAVLGAGEQVRLGPHPPVVLTERFAELGIKRHIPILPAFALPDMDDHAAAVNISYFQPAQLGAPHPG